MPQLVVRVCREQGKAKRMILQTITSRERHAMIMQTLGSYYEYTTQE
jgi:hypothetical protein